MYKYKCLNKKCSTYNKIVEEYGIHNRYHPDGSITDLKAICPECSSVRELVESNSDKEGLCTHAYSSSGNICNK